MPPGDGHCWEVRSFRRYKSYARRSRLSFSFPFMHVERELCRHRSDYPKQRCAPGKPGPVRAEPGPEYESGNLRNNCNNTRLVTGKIHGRIMYVAGPSFIIIM